MGQANSGKKSQWVTEASRRMLKDILTRNEGEKPGKRETSNKKKVRNRKGKKCEESSYSIVEEVRRYWR